MSQQLSSLEVSVGGGEESGITNSDPLAVPDMSYHQGTEESRQTIPKTSTALAVQYLSLPIVYLLFFVQVFLASLKSVVTNPLEMWREFVETNRETNELLKEMPKEQKEQREELHYIHEEQIHQNDRLEDLRRRINRLEERRRAREEAVAGMADPIPKLEEYLNSKKDK